MQYFYRIVVLEANKMMLRSGPTFKGPYIGSSLLATEQQFDRTVSD